MAYMSQENKKLIAPQIKAILKKYKMKGSISVQHHSKLVVTIKEGALDIIDNLVAKGSSRWVTRDDAPDYITVNTYWMDNSYTGDVLNFLNELKDAMNGAGSTGEQNFDKSDIQSDYFHVGWYIDISVGKWDKPFVLTSK
jgi:hypothetical protein